MMIMKRFMLVECVGGCRARLLIDISDLTHSTYILQCRCLVLGSFVVHASLSSLLSVSAQGLQPI